MPELPVLRRQGNQRPPSSPGTARHSPRVSKASGGRRCRSFSIQCVWRLDGKVICPGRTLSNIYFGIFTCLESLRSDLSRMFLVDHCCFYVYFLLNSGQCLPFLPPAAGSGRCYRTEHLLCPRAWASGQSLACHTTAWPRPQGLIQGRGPESFPYSVGHTHTKSPSRDVFSGASTFSSLAGSGLHAGREGRRQGYTAMYWIRVLQRNRTNRTYIWGN